MKAGLLRHWLEIQSPTVSGDGYSGVVKTWATVPGLEAVPAAIDAISGREFLAADRELAGASWRITLRETPGVTVEPNMRGVELDGDAPRTFDFVAILPSHAREQLTIAATGGTSQP
jgi:head-tail adaptor